MTDEVLIVVWDDAVAGNGWKSHDDAEACQRVTSIGLLVVEDEARIVLAGSWGLNEGAMETNNRITIPKGFIVSKQPLKMPRKPAALRGKSV